MSETASLPAPANIWFYRDLDGVRGPFTAAQMSEWLTAGYLPADLQMRTADEPDSAYIALSELTTRDPNGEPPFHKMATEGMSAELEALCKGQQHLKDAGIDPALRTAEQHSATSARFVQAVTRLLRYKMDVAGADEQMGRAVCAAIETRRAALTVGYGALLSSEHPLLDHAVGDDTDSEGLIRGLAGGADAALARAEGAKDAMPTHDALLTLHEDAWREHALARDQARQEQVNLAQLHLEGLRAKQRCLERALSGMHEVTIELPEPEGDIAQSNVADAIDEAARSLLTDSPLISPPLLTACANLAKCVELGQAGDGEGRAQVAAIAARVAEEHRNRRPKLQAALHVGAVELRAMRSRLQKRCTVAACAPRHCSSRSRRCRPRSLGRARRSARPSVCTKTSKTRRRPATSGWNELRPSTRTSAVKLQPFPAAAMALWWRWQH